MRGSASALPPRRDWMHGLRRHQSQSGGVASKGGGRQDTQDGSPVSCAWCVCGVICAGRIVRMSRARCVVRRSVRGLVWSVRSWPKTTTAPAAGSTVTVSEAEARRQQTLGTVTEPAAGRLAFGNIFHLGRAVHSFYLAASRCARDLLVYRQL